ncbi:MAG TPA: thiamine-phosphate kinase [Opitutaceae bacterium]|nr:thiamine-phosphate kinase [Opitutaceae bacterium]
MNPFTRQRAAAVTATGELRLIGLIRRWLGPTSPPAPFGVGDDCAVLPPSRHPQLVTTDPVIYGRHFDDRVPARAAGAKLLKRNLSDIAAMGGRPQWAVVSLALAPETRLAWLREFYLGLAGAARRYGVKIVGGDITEGPAGFLGAFLTLHGEAAAGRVVTRTGAREGDGLFVTGPLGGSGAGHHHRFVPRIAEGAWLAGQREVVAMMDVSDGVAKDVQCLTPHGLVASVWPPLVPVTPAARAAARRSGRPAWQHALSDGEDYELLVVLRAPRGEAEFARRWQRRFGRPLHALGRFQRKAGPEDVDWRSLHGYEHLR